MTANCDSTKYILMQYTNPAQYLEIHFENSLKCTEYPHKFSQKKAPELIFILKSSQFVFRVDRIIYHRAINFCYCNFVPEHQAVFITWCPWKLPRRNIIIVVAGARYDVLFGQVFEKTHSRAAGESLFLIMSRGEEVWELCNQQSKKRRK